MSNPLTRTYVKLILLEDMIKGPRWKIVNKDNTNGIKVHSGNIKWKIVKKYNMNGISVKSGYESGLGDRIASGIYFKRNIRAVIQHLGGILARRTIDDIINIPGVEYIGEKWPHVGIKVVKHKDMTNIRRLLVKDGYKFVNVVEEDVLHIEFKPEEDYEMIARMVGLYSKIYSCMRHYGDEYVAVINPG